MKKASTGSERPEWGFESVGPMGGATGNAYADTLQGAGKTPEEEFAREVIQNSCDAADPNGYGVRVVFRIVTLHGEDRERFIRALSLRDGIGRRLGSLRLPPSNCLAAKHSAPLQLTFVDDYGTVGLYGDPHRRRSNFHKLLLSLGESSKAFGAEGSGGSYGYGKSVLSMNSRLKTIVAYSVFDPERDDSGASARLMGCGYFDAHEFDGEDWTGRAWFGIASERGVYSPLENEAAHALARQLGFKPRGPGEYGTSVLIVDSAMDHRKLLRGIEEWWWPRIVDQQLEVEVLVDDQVFFPRPKKRMDLLPFIECYSMAVGRSEPVGSHQRKVTFNRLHGLNLGSYAIQLLPTESADELPEEKLGCVAMIRSPKMVVAYARLGRTAPPAVGVFVAASEIDEILKLSEPPTHERWDPDSRRLQNATPNESVAREIVQTIAKRSKDQIRRFQSQATPPRPQEERRLRLLERELGALLRPSTRDGDGGGAGAEPVEIRYREGPKILAYPQGNIATYANVALKLRDDAEDDRVEATVRVRVPVLEDDEGSEGDDLPLTIESEDFDPPRCGEIEPRFEVVLTKDRWMTFSLRSDPYEPAWSTKVVVEIEPTEAAT